MKKKILTLMLAGVTAAGLLAGCGGSSSTGDAAPAETEAPAEDAAAAETPADTETDAEASEEAPAAQGEGGTLIVGFDQDFPPMGFVGDDGEFTGFDLALAAEVADRLSLTVVYQPIAWDAKDMELKTGAIDCIWNGFTIDGREDKYEWTEPYMANKQVFVVKADAGIKALTDLAGKVVAVQADSSAEAALADAPELKDSFGELKAIADYNTGLMELESGAVDCVAMDETVAGYQLTKRGDDKLVMLDETLSEEEYGVGFLLGNTELRDSVQTTLEEMAADGTLTKISEEWFGKDVTIIGKTANE